MIHIMRFLGLHCRSIAYKVRGFTRGGGGVLYVFVYGLRTAAIVCREALEFRYIFDLYGRAAFYNSAIAINEMYIFAGNYRFHKNKSLYSINVRYYCNPVISIPN